MKNKFLFFTLMLLIGTQVAVDAQELTLSDVQNSGCLDSKHARANGRANINEDNRRPTIILTKEGTILTVQLYNYEANCGTTDFEVTPSISGGSNGAPYSVSIQVIPIGDEEDCICPYNISFTIHDLEATDFFFSCCWFQGLVTLTENKPLVLGDINEVVMAEVNIDGLNYTLENITNTARLIAAKRGYDIKGELNIPSEINYEEQKYRVTSLNEYAFLGCYDLTSVDIPYSVTSIGDAAFMGCSSLTDVYCHAEDVPNTSNSVFTSTPIASATLHVPAGSIDKYKTTSPWSDFGSIVALPQQYFPEGTKWTEIRLDTLKYDSWYSKVDGEWVPNFETIEYRVQGEYGGEGNPYSNDPYKCVYTNSSEWTDSLTLLISEGELNGFPTGILVTVYDNEIDQPLVPSSYPFEWEVGTMIRFKDILAANMTALFPRDLFDFGVVEEIKEAYFGGVRLLKYSDVKGVRMIQGIGVVTWNDGECIFGPLKPYDALPLPHEESRHYRSMLVHFERDGEVLYDVWPKKEAAIEEPVTFTKDQMATIILPTAPDASKGKYYRLDRVEDGQIIFEQEKQPRARVPYIIVPSEDFSIDISSLDLESLQADTVTVGGVSFIGSYVRKTLPQRGSGEGAESFYIDIIDTTPDCGFLSTAETGKEAFRIGALRAYLTVNWDDPYNHHGSKSPEDKLDIVLKDDGTGIEQIQSSKFKIQNDGEEVNGKWSNGKCYDLSGRKWSMINGQFSMPKGIYIQNNRKLVK